MRIGIIGSGRIGGTLAEKFAAAGHEICLANAHGPRSLEERVERMGARVRATTVDEAAACGEIVVVSIPLGSYRTVPVEPLAGKIVIDTDNYYPQRDGHIAELDDDSTTSTELLQRHLPESRVVKAFNAVRWDSLADEGKPRGTADGSPCRWPATPPTPSAVAGLIDEIGFDPVDVGDLAHGGRKIQPGADVYVAHITAGEMQRRLAA